MDRQLKKKWRSGVIGKQLMFTLAKLSFVAVGFCAVPASADATAHAEILAIREAGRKLTRWRLTGCTLYVTLEPCPMCAGAIMSARISRLVYGATDARAGAVESIFNIPGHPSLAPSPIITAGVMEDECKALLQSFFAARR